MVRLLQHSYTPSPVDETTQEWPRASQLILGPKLTAVMFAHPKCPCLAQGLRELDALIQENSEMSVILVFAMPPGAQHDWYLGKNWNLANRYGIARYVDYDGVEARLFGATSSGEMLVFEPSGQCRFVGGITPGRGHEGPSTGAEAVRRLWRSDTRDFETSAVYGCPLFGKVE